MRSRRKDSYTPMPTRMLEGADLEKKAMCEKRATALARVGATELSRVASRDGERARGYSRRGGELLGRSVQLGQIERV